MKLGLCMVVKNEARQLGAGLGGILDLFDEAVIVDTGSTDGTAELLRREFGIRPLKASLIADRCFCLQDPRKLGLQHLSTDWVMFLDADERIDPAVLLYLRRLPDEPDMAGYFGLWRNFPPGESSFDDYKLFIFRRGLEPVGLVHDNVQLDIRRKRMNARWMEELVVDHFPDPGRASAKKSFYRRRLNCAITRQPDFLRYRWFRGYMDFREGAVAEAEQHLVLPARAASLQFPVECINSAMVLSELYAHQGRAEPLAKLLHECRAFHGRVAEDFEVKVNFAAGDWLQRALENCASGRLGKIRAPRFAC